MALRDIKEKDFDYLMQINLKKVFMLSQLVSEKMIADKSKRKIIDSGFKKGVNVGKELFAAGDLAQDVLSNIPSLTLDHRSI